MQLPTRANLSRRRVNIQDTACPLCGDVQEEVGHLFFNCKKILGLWWESMSWIQAMGPLSVSPVDHFLQFCDGFGAERNHSTCCGWWVALTSTIWKHRNFLIFQNKPFEPQKVMEDAMFSIWSWLKARQKGYNISFNHWSSNISDSFGGVAWAFWRAAPMNKEPPNILQYADDTAFEGEALWENVLVLKALLRGFELASGLKINYAKNRLPTKGNLLRRHVDIQDAGCPLCGQGQEEVGHLFFNCKRTINMWWESMGWIKAVGPLPASPLNHFVQFCVGFGTNTNQSTWSAWWAMLRGFEMASGLKINYAKSQFGIFGDYVNWSQEAAHFLNCRQMGIPFHYLGIPIGVRSSNQVVWEPLISKFEAKLTKWNQKSLSMAGRVNLINFVLNALPIYLLSFFKLPQRIVDRLNIWRWDLKWRRHLFEHEEGLEFPFSYLGIPVGSTSKSWDVWQPVISKFESKVAKWKQRCLSMGDRIFLTALPIYLLSFFKIPKKVVHKLPWADGGVPFKERFSELYQISSQRLHSVEDMGYFSEHGWEWNFSWRRNLFDSEMGVASTFLETIAAIRICGTLKDTWLWGAEPNGIFSTKSAYNLIKVEQLLEDQDSGFHQLWDLKVPPKVLSFAWRLLWDRLPTKDNLSRRQIQLDNDLCPLCQTQPETASYLFFTCDKVLPLWWEFFTWVKEGTALHNSPMANFLHTSTTTGGKNITRRRKTWWLAATKSIWQSINDLVFHNQAFDIHKLIDNSIFLTWTWLKGWEKNFYAPFHHWSSAMSLALTLKLLQEHNKGLDQTYLREVAKEKKHRLLTMLECNEHDARP
ncbi:hypothetical protein HKD37_12G034380 [Glycine soja]